MLTNLRPMLIPVMDRLRLEPDAVISAWRNEETDVIQIEATDALPDAERAILISSLTNAFPGNTIEVHTGEIDL